MSANNETKWQVTEFGIEARGSVTYLIPKEDLARLRDAEKGIGDWPLQMAAKTWVNMDELWKVYVEGLRCHNPPGQSQIDLNATWMAVTRIRGSS